MRKISRHSMLRFAFIVFLIFGAFIFGKFYVLFVLPDKLNIFCGMVSASLYIFLFTAWGISIRYRLVSKKARRLLQWIAALIVFWFIIRTVKYFMVENMMIRRLLWYSYYIPLLMIIILSTFIIHAIGKASDYRFSKKFYIPFIVTILLCILVITNDLHQLVFRFPDDAVIWLDSEYTYGIGYYIIAGWIVICTSTLLIELMRKYRSPLHYRNMFLPFIPIALALVYCYMYASGSFLTKYILNDMTAVLCLTIISVYECCIGAGLIPVNIHYTDFFANSQIPVYLLSRNYSLFMSSKNAPELKNSYIEESLEIPVIIDHKNRLSSTVINGGFVLWIDDVSKSIDMVHQLQDINETLLEKQMVIQEEYRTKKEKLHLEESNRLYNRMQLQTSSLLFRMEELRDEIKNVNDKKQEKKYLYEMIILGTFFKRRNNLLFISETEHTVQYSELQYCMDEILSAIQLNQVNTTCHVKVESSMSIFNMMDLVDHFYEVVMSTLFHLKSIAVVINENIAGYQLHVNILLHEPMSLNLSSDFDIEEEEESEAYLTYLSVKKEEVK